MTLSETAETAIRAWAAATQTHNPMPLPVAVDMVLDTCDYREDAITALVVAASNWLRGRLPPEPVSPHGPSAAWQTALACCGCLQSDAFTMASCHADWLLDWATDVIRRGVVNPRIEIESAVAYREWAQAAKWAIEKCEHLE